MDKTLMAVIGMLFGLTMLVACSQMFQPVLEYTCLICGEKFATEEELAEHMITMHPTPGGFACPYCSEVFDTLTELVEHVATEHPDEPPIQEIDIGWD